MPVSPTPGRSEALPRYVARPMVVGERVSELADGRVAWRRSVPGGRGETHRIMEPMEFMARLAALVPPPRRPLLRYHGVFAPHSPWRSVVVPSQSMVPRACEGTAAEAAETTSATRERDAAAGANDDVWVAEGGERDEKPVGAKSSGRIDWATLMHRVWGWDVLACPRCDGRMRFIAVIKERDVIERILTHVGLSAARIVAAPARRWDDTS